MSAVLESNITSTVGLNLTLSEYCPCKIYWRTSWAIIIVLGLFLLYLLLQVRGQLMKLNQTQVDFHRTWAEVRASELEILEEERRQERQNPNEQTMGDRVDRSREILRRAAARMRRERQRGNFFNEDLGDVASVSSDDTPENDHFMQDF
ncbi:hypothetical protein F4801DRAFT_580258 [Xylaria longipes]|nr:hypothetical protein F4801DRAFT_580258 [Xylaria longipes]